jgi:hypothetical protein
MSKKKSKKSKKSKVNIAKLLADLDSKTSDIVKDLLGVMAQGAVVPNTLIDELDDGDSRLSQIVPILRAINDKAVSDETIAAINSLDSFGAPLQPVLLALANR